MSKKDNQFKILQTANDSHVESSYNEVLEKLNEQLPSKETLADATKSAKFADFWAKHIISQTYFFQVRKCNGLFCSFHEPLLGYHEIKMFPDPVPSEVDGVLHYNEGKILEKYLKTSRNKTQVFH